MEAHGPGTPVGDPIEYASLAEVYGIDGPCALASVKTNFGHTQSAAGTLGLMKAILALQHGEVPQNLHFTRLPDDLAQIETNLFVPQEITPWPTNGQRPRRAAVSSYGVSGTNAHAIVEQAPETTARNGRRIRDRRVRCCSRCHLAPRMGCGKPRSGWLAGCKSARTRWSCRIWPTRWRGGAPTGRCARR